MDRITYNNQVDRLNRVVKAIKEFTRLPVSQLRTSPAPGAWSILETVEHMNKAYAPHYREKLVKVLAGSPKTETAPTVFKPGWMARLAINSIRPKDGERKMKMKTLGKFKPEQETALDPEVVFAVFFDHQEHLKAQILEARKRVVGRRKLSSAIGPLVRFTVPEAIEFVLTHEERHVLQCRETLEQIEGLPEQHSEHPDSTARSHE